MRKTFVLFLLVGGVQYVLDAGIFSLLVLSLDTSLANVLSRLSGACAGYYLNGYFTFGVINQKNVFNLRRIVKFSLVWTGLTLVSTLSINMVVSMLPTADWHYIVVVKLVVEAVLVILSFLMQKFFVYR